MESENMKKEEKQKIKIETSADLYKLPISVIKNTKLYDFQGKYFDQIYNEALKIERSGGIENLSMNTLLRKDNEIIISKVTFEMTYQTQLGQELGVIGSINPLGNWNQDNALRMKWTEGNVWLKEIPLDNSQGFDFKFIFVVNSKVQKWEDGDNRSFNIAEAKQLIEANLKGSSGNSIKVESIRQQTYVFIFNDNNLKIVCNWNKK